MPWLTPGQGGTFGFVPYSASYGENFQVNYYIVTSSESQIFPGDPLTAASGGANTMFPVARLTSSASGTIPLLGVAAHGLAANAGSSSATLTALTSSLLLVYDSPDQMFYANDSSSFIISSTQVGRNIQFGPAAGSTTANRSGYFLSGATASSNPSFPFRLQSIHPASWIVGGVSTAGATASGSTDIRPWVVKPVNHYYGQASTSIAT